jgi:hypothetical protein
MKPTKEQYMKTTANRLKQMTTQSRCCSGNTVHLHSGAYLFEPLTGYRQSWLKFSLRFVSSSSEYRDSVLPAQNA